MAAIKNTSSLGTLANYRSKRRAIVDLGIARLDAINTAMRNNITRTTNTQVQVAEMGVRSKAQADMKARMSKLTQLQSSFNKRA